MGAPAHPAVIASLSGRQIHPARADFTSQQTAAFVKRRIRIQPADLPPLHRAAGGKTAELGRQAVESGVQLCYEDSKQEVGEMELRTLRYFLAAAQEGNIHPGCGHTAPDAADAEPPADGFGT